MPSVSEKIKDARVSAGMTQKQLADAVGVTQKDVSRWENGVIPGSGKVQEIEKALGTGVKRKKPAAKAPVDPDARYVQTLCYYRRQKKMTVQELAAASGVTEAIISGIENGKVPCVKPWLTPLSKALGCNPEDIGSVKMGAVETEGDLTEWAGKTTVKAITGGVTCGWCGAKHEGLACKEEDLAF